MQATSYFPFSSFAPLAHVHHAALARDLPAILRGLTSPLRLLPIYAQHSRNNALAALLPLYMHDCTKHLSLASRLCLKHLSAYAFLSRLYLHTFAHNALYISASFAYTVTRLCDTSRPAFCDCSRCVAHKQHFITKLFN
jgi:hypothetical protein